VSFFQTNKESMIKSRIVELMAKKIGKEASKDELDELSELLLKNPGYAYLLEIVLSLKGSRNHFERDLPQEELVDHGSGRQIKSPAFGR